MSRWKQTDLPHSKHSLASLKSVLKIKYTEVIQAR